jgi:hypothetical protein
MTNNSISHKKDIKSRVALVIWRVPAYLLQCATRMATHREVEHTFISNSGRQTSSWKCIRNLAYTTDRTHIRYINCEQREAFAYCKTFE